MKHTFNISKVITEWAYRLSNGTPNMGSRYDLLVLRQVLTEQGYPPEFVQEYMNNLSEDDIVKNKKSGNQYVVQNHNPDTQTLVTKDASAAEIEKAEAGEEEQEQPATEPPVEKPKQVNKKFPKTAQDKQWTGDTPDDIAIKVSVLEAPEVSPISDPVDVNNRIMEYREGVFSGEIVGKGGTTTTVQEEMANISREIANSPNFEEPPSLSEQLNAYVSEKYPNSPFSKKFPSLAKKSSAGSRTMANMKRNEKIRFNETQPSGYPINTTDNIVVRDLLITKLKEAEASGDSESASHYRSELYFYQKKATDKSVTGKEGDADTMVIYHDTEGRERILYITNKQSTADQMSSSTINGTLKSIERHAGKHFDEQDAAAGAERVMRIATEQHKKAETYNETYANNINAVASEPESREELRGISNVIGKAFSVDWGSSGKKEYQKRDEDRALKYSNEAMGAPEVQAALLGLDPYSGDPEYNEWKKLVSNEWQNNESDFTPEEIAQATIDATGTGNLTSVGSGKATSATYSLIKATQVTLAIRTKVNSVLEKNGGNMDEAINTVLGQTNKDGEPLFGGVFNNEDVQQIMASKGLEKLESAERQRGADIEGMYSGTTKQLAKEDSEMGIDGVPPKNGPHVKSYVNGFLDRVHLSDYVSGDVDGRVVGEYGNNSVTPTHFRKALAKLTEFDGDINDHKALQNHLLEIIIPSTGSQELVYVNKNNERIVIGTDTHRTGGRTSKVAGQLGKQLQTLLVEISNSETE